MPTQEDRYQQGGHLGDPVAAPGVLDFLKALWPMAKPWYVMMQRQTGTAYWEGLEPPPITTNPIVTHVDLPACCAVGVTNDGPADIEVRFPDDANANWMRINNAENPSADFGYATVSSVGIRLRNGVTASVRLKLLRVKNEGGTWQPS